MGCMNSRMEPSLADLEAEIDALQIPWTEDHYPRPKPPQTKSKEVFKVEDYAEIDRRAKQTPEIKATTYPKLMNYLIKGCTTEMEKLRSIFSWMASQQERIQHGNFDNVTDYHTPVGYMKLMHERKGNYSAFFAILCRYVNQFMPYYAVIIFLLLLDINVFRFSFHREAELACVIVYGISKSYDYEVGDRDIYHLRNCWNAVHVDEEWRLIHPLWAFRKVKGFNPGRWQFVQDPDVKYQGRAKEEKGEVVDAIDEFYFLVEPEVFLHMCRPAADMVKWQLVPNPWSFEKFVHAPVLRQKYFSYKLKLMNQNSCIISTSDYGTAEIQFEDNDLPELTFTHELFFDNHASFNDLPTGIVLDKYCLISRKQNKVSFHIRCPVPGIYKLRIYSGFTVLYNVCDFRIECDKAAPDVKPYPLIRAVSFGFTQNAIAKGLDYPSEYGGIIKLQSGQGKIFTFGMTSDVDVRSVLLHHYKKLEETKRYVVTKKRQENFHSVERAYVNVYVNLPLSEKEDEYALHIYTRQKGSKENFINALNYLIIMDKMPAEVTNGIMKKKEKPYIREVRENLRTAARRSRPNIEELYVAIQRAEHIQLDDKEILEEARIKREKLVLERDLRLAILRRKEEFLDDVLARVQDARFEHHLDYLLMDAIDVRDQLRRLKMFLHDVLQLTQPTISEIHNYMRPRDTIHDVMTAVFLILGEEPVKLKKWEYIQHQMRQVGRTSLIARIKRFDVTNVDMTNIEKAHRLIETYTEEAVNDVSVGVAIFYKWAQNIIVELTVTANNEIQKYRGRREKIEEDAQLNHLLRNT
ncbi:hillarin-like [Gigantopelta aegis]|uniref:hillarin-like n=1 Tax=Gigantopelta aegis TaxID=1735272 RepID=UPI001B88E052|nr:hillarin-like [Gigantopelta aegis]